MTVSVQLGGVQYMGQTSLTLFPLYFSLVRPSGSKSKVQVILQIRAKLHTLGELTQENPSGYSLAEFPYHCLPQAPNCSPSGEGHTVSLDVAY